MKNRIIIACLILMVGSFVFAGCGEKASEQEQIVGGFSENRDVTEDDMIIFKAALSEDQVQKHVPKAVATQIVSGTNYRFHCAVMDGNEESGEFVDITIYDSLNDNEPPTITAIEEISGAE